MNKINIKKNYPNSLIKYQIILTNLYDVKTKISEEEMKERRVKKRRKEAVKIKLQKLNFLRCFAESREGQRNQFSSFRKGTQAKRNRLGGLRVGWMKTRRKCEKPSTGNTN